MMESKPITYTSGNTYWRLPDGRCHREDGPAICNDGTQFWYKYGKCHRLDGPAVIWKDGPKLWVINGNNVTTKIHKWAEEMNIDLDNL